jgi:uncharacterized protein YfaS (alpha-2-macroglobulin family)
MRKILWLALMTLLLLGVPLAAGQEGTAEPVDAGSLAVTDVLPAPDSMDVATDATITVIFNRPVVPLTTMADAQEARQLPSPISINPTTEGQGEWLNTSIYVFHPDPALMGGSKYTVTVDPDLAAVDGATMEQPYSWAFTTTAPIVTSVTPTDTTFDVPLRQMIQVTFNMPVERQSAEAAFSLTPDQGDEAVAGEFEWAEDSTGFSFTPSERLALDTMYVAEIAGGRVVSAGGGAPMEAPFVWRFDTVPLPAIVSTSPFDEQTDATPYGGFTIYFASAMDVDTLEDKVTIEPEPWREFDTYYSDWDNSYTLSFPTEPSTDYTITIAPGMADIYGNTIDEELVVSYTTLPYDPEVMLEVPGTIGFYNAYNEQTQLFLTHRNISRVDLRLYQIQTEDLLRSMLSQEYYDPLASLPMNPDNLLRQWSIPNVAPENARRYELLQLSARAAAECEGAPASRIAVGDAVVVITEPDPLRARSTPVEGEVIAQLYADYQLPVTGGPVCGNNMLWWEVQLRDGQTAWVAEGDSEEYFLDVAVAAERTPVAVEAEDGGPLAPGVYALSADAPEFEGDNRPPLEHVLVVGTANLTMKTSVDGLLVWATNVNTGQPIASAPITIYEGPSQGYNATTGELETQPDIDLTPVANGTTDADGLLAVELPRAQDLYRVRLAVLQTESEFGLTSVNWSDGIEPWNFGINPNYYPAEYRTYLYTDRPIYRPGQPVYFRGILRLQDDVTYSPPDVDSIPVAIFNDQGDTIYEATLPLTPFGTFNGQFDLAEDAALGYYRLAVQTPDQVDAVNQYSGTGISFGVAEYRAPEFQVNVTAETPEVVQGDTIRAVVDSSYFFGGAVSGGAVEYHVIADPYYFEYTGRGSYSFADYDDDAGPSEFYYYGGGEIASGSDVLDADGTLVIEIPADLEDSTQSAQFTIEATVSDESGQAVSGRTQVIVHKGLVYVGVRPEEYVTVARDAANVQLVTVDWESSPVANQDVDVEVVERRWSSVQEEDEFGRTTWTWEVEELPVTDDSVTTDENGQAVYSFTPEGGGIFKVRATTTDAQGNEVVAATTIYVAGPDYISWRQENSNRIDLVADSDRYEVGDTAQVLITSPFQGETKALVTVERGGVLQSEVITMSTNSYIYEVPITPDLAPNAFVSVVIVRGVDETNPVAAFRVGLVELPVSNEQKEITVEVEPNVEQAGPGDTVTYTLTTTDYAGNPVQAEVGVGLTDLAVLTIADPNSGPLLDAFYSQQPLSVRTSTPLTINTDQLTQTVLDTIKGGGGGFGEGGIFDIRQEFVDTPYWNAELVTDENGLVTFDVTLPDNLTTWRLDARAVTSGDDGLTLVGQTTLDLLSTKPLLIRPVTPRFFVTGDEVTLQAVVNNNSGEDLEVEVTLDAQGVTVNGEATQTVTIPDGQRTGISWQVTIDDVESVDLTFFAQGGDFTDASKPPLGQGDARLLPVYRYEVPETVGTGGLLEDAETITEAISLPSDMDITQGELNISLDQSLAATTIDGLEFLRNFPYQCVEQTVSRFLPNIMTYRALESLGVDDANLREQLETNVNYGLQLLFAQQHVDGGWGWFVRDQSNPLVTAYALIGLVEADAQGFAVSEDLMAQAAGFLRANYGRPPSANSDTWELNRQAFVLYALARAGAPDIARMSSLYEYRDRLNTYAKAFLAMAFNLTNSHEQSRIDTLLSDLSNDAILSATGAHWEDEDWWNWGTDTRATAIALDAFVQLDPDNALIPNMVRYLMSVRSEDAWETTQETAWAVMSLTDWMVVSGELNANYSYSAELNGETLAEGAATSDTVRESTDLTVQVADLLADQANELVISRTEGEGNLYYTAHLRAFLPVPEVEAVNAGLIIERRYTLLDEASENTVGDPISEAHVGDTIQVRLTIVVPEGRHYVVVEDPIPAGTDAVNPDLNTSQQIGTQPELNREDPLSQGWGWWWFSDIEFRDEKVVLSASYLPAGTYEFVYSIRAGLPGVYNIIPSTGYELYFPEVYGRSAGSTFTILPAEA